MNHIGVTDEPPLHDQTAGHRCSFSLASILTSALGRENACLRGHIMLGSRIYNISERRNTWHTTLGISFLGFVVKPETLPDGTLNLMIWKCINCGKKWVSSCNIFFYLLLLIR
ncbi:hypothetical protein Hanom_Chr17g01538241 [Helianthus anomalus]